MSAPLRGEWRALNTPAERIPSHGTDRFGQRYAFDFCQTDAGGKRLYDSSILGHVAGAKPVSHFYCWGRPVFAAYPGTVVGASDGWPDRTRVNLAWDLFRANLLARAPQPDDLRPLLGNHVLVRGETGVALYAHLQQGSVSVAKGAEIAEGAQLGLVGNSGNTTMPHLHFHLMNDSDIFKADGVLCGFKGYERWQGAGWEWVDEGIPGAFERVRFASIR